MRGLVLFALLSLVAVPASAQVSDSTTAAPDTGWVEIGGPSGFGADDPFADLPSEEDEGPVQPEGGRLFPYLGYNRVDQFTVGLDMTYKPSKGWMPARSMTTTSTSLGSAGSRRRPR